MVNKIDRFVTNLEKRMLQVLFIAMTLLVLVQVFNRAMFNYQMAWADEASRYLFVWIVFIASAYAIKEKAHIGVNSIVVLFPKKVQHIISLIVYCLCLAFCAVLAINTISVIKTQIVYGQISPSLRIPMPYAYSAVVVGSLLMVINFVLLIVTSIQESQSLEKRSKNA